MSDDDTAADSRRDRLDARRRRFRWAGIACAVMIVGGAATVAAFTLTDEADSTVEPTEVPAPSADDASTVNSFGEDELPELAEVAPEDETRPLSYEDPLRVWVGGDSLAGALGPALGNFNDATGVVETTVDYKVSSGLATQVRNWPKYAPDALDDVNPEVVVFMIGTNDATIVNSQDRDNDGIDDWEPDYREKVAHMMDLLLENNRVVLWVGAPTMRDDDRDEGAIEVNRVMRQEAEKRAPNVVFVDAYRIFSDDDGGYSDTLQNANGENIRVRIGDGVHFTPKGAEHLAAAVFALLDARYDIQAQKDPEHAKKYRIVSGSGGGTSSDGSSNRRTTSTTSPGSSATTTPVTDGSSTPTSVATPGTTTPPTTGAPTTTPPDTSPTTSPSPPTSGP